MDSEALKLLWISTAVGAGIAVVITLIAAAEAIPKWSVVVLVILGCLFFHGAAIGLGWAKLQPTNIKSAILLGIIWVGMTALGFAVWPKDGTGRIKAIIKTRVVGRLYARVVTPPPGQTVDATFSFQEVFYEWSVSLSADGHSVASLKADYLQENDIFRVEPEGATTERVPESPLGFKTFGTSKPSHYALIVKSDDLTETQSLTVTIRRSITAALVDSDLIKLAYVRSATSKVEQSTYDTKADVERLKRQAKTIAEWKYPPQTTPLPIHPPGDVPAGVMQSAVEVWCKDEECKQMTMGNLVAEWNRVVPSP